jgi:hypothetical protein
MYDITAEAKTHRAELAPALLVVFNKLGGGEFGTFCFDARFVKPDLLRLGIVGHKRAG